MGAAVVDAILNPRERTKLMRYGDYFHVAVHDCDCSRGRRRAAARSTSSPVPAGCSPCATRPSDGSPGRSRRGGPPLRAPARRAQQHRAGLPAVGDLRRARRRLLRRDRPGRRTPRRASRRQCSSTRPPPGIPQRTFAVRRDLTTVRRAAAPLREVVNAIIRARDRLRRRRGHRALPRRLRPRAARRRPRRGAARPADRPARGQPRGHVEPAQPGDEEDDVVGRDPHRRHAHRRHLRHELPPHARARLGVRLPGSRSASWA